MVVNSNKYIYSLLYGTMLGDGYCSNSGRIDITRADYIYVNWFYQQLKNEKVSGPPKTYNFFDKRTNKTYIKHTFSIYTSNKNYRKLFYILNSLGGSTKILPKDFKENLNDIVLAIWFMDDGGRANGVQNGVFFTMDSFTLEETLYIKKCFLDVFGIEARYQLAGKSKSGRVQHRLYINTKNYPIFHKLVYPIVSQVPTLHAKRLPDVKVKKLKTD